jgi:hypothetical protein
MADYWKNRLPVAPKSPTTPSESNNPALLSEFDWHRLMLLAQGSNKDWRLELRRYLQDVPPDVTRDTDIVAWWSVRAFLAYFLTWYRSIDFTGSC